MNQTLKKDLIGHGVVLLLFIAIIMIYFSPLLEGKVLRQMDVDHWQGMSKEISDFRKTEGSEPLWTNSMFGGMPAYQISVVYPANLIQYIDKVILFLPMPANLVFLYLIGFYFMLITMKIDKRIAFLGSVAFAFSSFFFIIIAVGHNSQAVAIGYMAPVIAGVVLTYRRNPWLGAAVFALAFALELNANHVQITYYLMIIMLCLGIAELYRTFISKQWGAFLKSSGLLAVGGLIALGCSITSLWATSEYGKYTTRGPSELSSKQESTGLPVGYAFDWSYGVDESFTLLVPNYKGGSSSIAIKEDKSALEAVPNTFRGWVGGFPQYWGDQKFTSGPVYVGAIICFLFLLGFLLLDGPERWWLLAATIISVVLSWGKNFPGFNDWIFYHIPGYNKFRSVTMTLVIAEFTMPLLAMLALQRILQNGDFFKHKRKQFFIATGVSLGLTFILAIAPTTFADVYKNVDVVKNGKVEKVSEYTQLVGELKKQKLDDKTISDATSSLETARKKILSSDAWRSFAFILLSALIIFLWQKYKFNANYALIGMTVFVLIDMVAVDQRYLNGEDFAPKGKTDAPYQESTADIDIHKDRSLDYRVLNLKDPFNDARTSYFHKSIGGYHGAKLKRSQELIDEPLSNELSGIIDGFNSHKDSILNLALKNASCLNMLNAKYLIYNPDAPPLPNRNALGNAWFVKEVKWVANADSELQACFDFNPSTTAIVDQRFKDQIGNVAETSSTTDSIKLNSYKANDLVYQYGSASERIVVFSEIYFEKGWNAYIDGKLTPHFRTNYVLRGMKVPAGNHKVEFKFEPTVYATGERISLVCSVLLLGFVGGIFWKAGKGKLSPHPTSTPLPISQKGEEKSKSAKA